MREDRFNAAVARPLDKPYTRKKKKRLAPLKALPTGEKLLYLFTVIVCVAMAVIVLSRFAKVTELNVAIQNTEQEIKKAEKEIQQLETESSQLRSVERIRKFAEQKGLELTAPKYLPSIRP
ncbi:MAG: cell division protein FtsL [Thermoactinomyces sp.]